MSETKKFDLHKLSIKCKNPDSPLTGMNASVTIDGKEVKGLTFLKVELKPNRVAKVTMELITSIDIEGDALFAVPFAVEDENDSRRT